MIKPFPSYHQLDAMDCGATCLRMIAKYYGRSFSNQTLREKSFITRSGVSLLGISEASESNKQNHFLYFRPGRRKVSND
jgi:ATP-binding cassette subfamily B protein